MISGGPLALGLLGATEISADACRSWPMGRVICLARATAKRILATARPAPRNAAQRTVLQAVACISVFLIETPTDQLAVEGWTFARMSGSPSREVVSRIPVRSFKARQPWAAN